MTLYSHHRRSMEVRDGGGGSEKKGSAPSPTETTLTHTVQEPSSPTLTNHSTRICNYTHKCQRWRASLRISLDGIRHRWETLMYEKMGIPASDRDVWCRTGPIRGEVNPSNDGV
ncbi:hypothetical protein CC79DRAFT_439843 [Sarocladium strictum]